ncbi:MAG: DUF1501 domain-containing protein [Planctomycetota bacterium]|jgi:hypothetical protein
MHPNYRSSLQAISKLQNQTRRHFLAGAGLGLGGIAMASMNPSALAGDARPLAPKIPPQPARAKNVIYLHMAGSPSQLELFDYKPELNKYNGQPCPKEYLEGKRFAFIKGVPKMLAPMFQFAQHGQSGQWISELLPNVSRCADDIAVIRSMRTDQFNHSPAQLLIHTGAARLGNPSLGSWATYGLGSENENLPGFVVLLSGGKTPDAGKSLWGSGFLPSVYQGVQCRTSGDPVFYLSNPAGVDRAMRRDVLSTLRDLNQEQFEQIGDPETLTRIEQFELAYRMQTSVPEVMDLSGEPQHVLDLYGAKPGFVSRAESEDDPRSFYRGDDPTLANNCLLARRLVESGVRFVQIYDWGWDHHGASPGESIDETLPIKCQQIDRALAGLITDLKQRGMLDSTLVIWGGEFGRTPMSQNNVRDTPTKGFFGRDHHPYAYSMLMAGGGVRGGVSFGQTDDIGYYVAENPVTPRDLQATVLHLLGFDPYRFGYAYQGLFNRLIGPTDEGRVIEGILS